jgi:tetratricopeptide (TPR) repeat protein
MLLKKRIFSLFCLFLIFSIGKVKGQSIYVELRNVYDNFSKNDETALPYVKRYIQKAKLEKDFAELKQGYEDYSYYSSNKSLKIKYADSAIIAAKQTKDQELISSAYLYKGSFYYFYHKNYPTALKEYLKAYQYSKNGNDEYLKNKIIYQIGLVKSYLGYYDEALIHFNKCIAYFEPKTIKKNYPTQIYNDSKGYLNSLHQIAVCYRNIKNYKKADSIINAGLSFSKIDEFPSEKAYFIKAKGISEYNHQNYSSAITLLQKSLPVFNKDDDFYWASVSDFYIGKSYLELGKEDLAIKQFEKVDSIFKKRAFIFPELQDNYGCLIYYYQKKNNGQKELAYTKDLLKVDEILKKDFPYLSSKLHKGYDNQILAEAKNKSENRNRWGVLIIAILVTIVIFLSRGIWKYYKNEKLIKQKYDELDKKLQQQSKIEKSTSYENISVQGKSIISADVFVDIQQKLKDFENCLVLK